MIKIKFIPAGQFYTSRSLKLFLEDKLFYISTSEVLILGEKDLGLGSLLKFKLDYHSKELNIKSESENTYILVYFKCRESLPLFLIDLMFRNSLDTKIVTAEEFAEPFKSGVLINKASLVNKKSKAFIKLVTLSVIISVLQFSVILIGDLNPNLSIIFGLFSIISATSFLWLWKNRKTLFYNQLYVKLISFIVFSIVFLFYTFSLNAWISGLLMALILLLILNIIVFNPKDEKKLSS